MKFNKAKCKVLNLGKVLWFNPSRQLSTTQPLAHSLPTQWDGG